MMKRIIALLLALILTVGLLPTVALAATTDGGTTTDGDSTGTISGGTVQVAGNPKQSVQHEAADDPIHIKKSVSEGENGKNYLTMEAYVTNPLEIKQEAVPIDIVLVLDVSGSMDDPLRNMNVPDFETYPNNMTNSDYLHYAQTGYGVYSAENVDAKISVTATDNYERVTRLTYDELKESGDNVSYYAKDNSGQYHSLSIKKYWGDWLQYYLYMDGKHYQKVHDWNSPIQLSGYEIYKLKTTYTYTDKTGKVILTSTGPNNLPTNNGQVVTFYYYNGETQKKVKKIAALKEAANNFIAKVAEQELPADAEGNAQYNRISIVKFAGNKSNSIGNDTYREGQWTYNNSQIVKGLTNVDATGVDALKKAVNELQPAGATRADYGMEKAQEALNNHGTRPSVVIMFTDGTPTKQSKFDAKVASDAVNAAKALKDAGTFVYTIAVYDEAKPSEDPTKPDAEDFNKYLHAVSSNYPTATATKGKGNSFDVTFGNRVSSEKNYYFNATNAIGLNNVFETISREVSNLALVVDSTAVLSDTLSGYFSFDVDVATKAGITVKRVPVTGGNATDGFTWADIDDATKVTDLGTNGVEIKGKSIEVKNFDYGSEENAVTVHADGRVTGAKLVITFPIKPDDSATWTEGTANYPTNSTTSPNEAGLGKYALKSDETNKNQKTQLTESPEIQITAHTVSYEVADNGNTGYTVPNSKVYREGQTYTIEDRLPDSNGYKFTGWCKDDRTCTSTPTTDPQTMGTTNVTYCGKFEKNEVTVDLSKFVQKKLELTGVTELPTEERFTVTLTEGSTTLTATTDAMKSTPDASNLPTFKNGLQSVTLSVGQHTFKVKETVGSTSGMNYDSAEYTLTVTANANGTAAANTVTITNSYAPTSGDGFALNDKFQKTLVSNVELSKLPNDAKSFELKIWEGTDTTADAKATGTATIDGLTKNAEGKYIGSKTFNFGTNATLTFTEAKEYTYTVKETVGTVAGMQYNTNTYTLTITVVNNNGKFEVQRATIGSTDMKDGGPLTITNTFTAATLPLDPDPTTGTGKIVKNLRLTGGTEETKEEMKFNVTVKDESNEEVANGEATIPAGSVDNTTVNFTKLGTLVFPEAGDYTYTIKETKGNTNGVTYDEKTYTLKVDVRKKEADNSLFVASAWYSYIDGGNTVSSNIFTYPITITNTYTEPTATVTKTTLTEETWDILPDDIKDNLEEYGYPQFPVKENNKLKLIVDKNVDKVKLAYVVAINGKAGSTVTISDPEADNTGEWSSAADDVDNTKVGFTIEDGVWTIQFKDDCTMKIFFIKTFNRNKTTGKFDTAINTVIANGSEIDSDPTTITDKDPGSFDFSDIVWKELKLTGSKSFTGAEFEATLTLKDFKQEVLFNSMLTTYAAAHVEAWDKDWSRTLVAKFDSTAVDGSTTNFLTTDGDHLFLDFPAAGTYKFELQETNKTRTNVTYDDTVYTIVVKVTTDKEHQNYDKLVVTNIGVKYVDKDGNNVTEDIYIGGEVTGKVMTFVNTVDTGKDDYYPIIIPTIINKDTGMLNKTDHFAYVIGYPDGTVHPNGQITRAEVATIFFRLLRDEVRDGAFTTSNSYSDVAYGKWYNNPISTMSALGIITGYPDGTFKPNKPITRAEFAAIAARFDETQSGKSATFSDVIGHWAAKEIGIAYYNDWIKGYPDGTFKPDQNITRAEAMTLINRVLERKPESPADLLTNMNKWTDNMDTSKWYYLDVQEATNSHGYTRKTFNYELWRQMLPDPDWSRYER